MSFFKELKASLEDAINCEKCKLAVDRRWLFVEKHQFNDLSQRLAAPTQKPPALHKLPSSPTTLER